METIGFVGVGKIGLPISENLIKSGYRVVGFRRSSLGEFEKIGGVPRARRPMSARRPISCSRACPRPRRSTTPCRARTASFKARVPARSSSSSARIRCPTSGARSTRSNKKARSSSMARCRAPPHGFGTQGRDLSRRLTPRRANGRRESSKALPTRASISASSAPRAASSWSTTFWSRSTSPPPRRQWRSG